MPRYVRVLDSAIGVPRVADTLAQWVDVDDLIEIPEGGGVTNSASINSIPITTDGDGNLGPSPLVLAGDDEIHFVVAPDGTAQIEVEGAGGQLHINAADGDETHAGGELSFVSGSSAGLSGGQINVLAGNDTGGGDGGNIVIGSGRSGLAEGGGNGGSIDIRAGINGRSDGDGGDINLVGGDAVDGSAGDVLLQPGNSTNGSQGTIQLYSADNNQGAEINNTAFNINDKLSVVGNVGFYGTSPVARPEVPASPTAQDVVDTLIALGLVTQAS